MIDSPAGATIAAPKPCAARAASSTPPDHANPPTSETSVKRASPAPNTRRRPKRSAARPPEQEEAAKGDAVGAHHPLEVLPGEAQILLHGRQGDVDYKEVEHDHEPGAA